MNDNDNVYRDLSNILGTNLAADLNSIQEPAQWPGIKDLDDTLQRWSQSTDVQVMDLGRSGQGKKIQVAIIGQGEKTFLAWGYPHPDEPIGAQALIELGDLKLNGQLKELEQWRFVFVLCADPDNAERQLWFDDDSVETFANGCWRPTHLGLEVDYGFPIDKGPFYQTEDFVGRCHQLTDCQYNCSSVKQCQLEQLPFSPLSESIALKKALRIFQPQIVAAMHSTHTSGDYTFLLQREKPDVLDDLMALPAATGSLRHLGEAIDRGVRWRKDAPDLIRERTYDYHRRRLQRHPQYNPEMVYAGNAAAAVIVETMLPDCQFVCPETALFRHPDFANDNLLNENIELFYNHEQRKKGKYEIWRMRHEEEKIIISQKKIDLIKQKQEKSSILPVPRSALGVKAVLARRQALAQADQLWQQIPLDHFAYHPYIDEKARTTVPGNFVADQSMLIFRIRDDYRRQANIAQAASFNWIWPLHTISLLANFANFLNHQDPVVAEPYLEKLSKIQQSQIDLLPPELKKQDQKAISIRSQAARLIRLMLAR